MARRVNGTWTVNPSRCSGARERVRYIASSERCEPNGIERSKRRIFLLFFLSVLSLTRVLEKIFCASTLSMYYAFVAFNFNRDSFVCLPIRLATVALHDA